MKKKKRSSRKKTKQYDSKSKQIVIGVIALIILTSLFSTFFILAGFISFVICGFLGAQSFTKKQPVKAKKYMTYAAISFGLILSSGLINAATDDNISKVTDTESSITNVVDNKQATTTSETSSSTKSTTPLSENEEISVTINTTEAVPTEEPKQETKSFDTSELAYKEFEGIQTIIINNNHPNFSDDELSLANGAWEKYGDLDSLNRATSAEAMLNQSLMPTEKRGNISKVTPTGWKNKKIKSGYLYNRSHLIGHALAGENDNWKNLITGTRQLNSPEMLRHEMDVKYYLDQSPNNYVRYSVTPVFRDNELLARGVSMRAQSINSDTIKFNVYIFNIQDGVTLNYADGSSEISSAEQEIVEQPIPPQQSEQQVQTPVNQNQTVYVTPTGEKYHTHAHGNGNFTPASLEEANARGLTPCKVCY